MMNLIKLISLAIVSLALNACQFNGFPFNKGVRGNGVVVTQQRPLNESFNAIEVSRGIDVFLTQSSTPKITIQADENIQDLIITKIESGTLKIYIDKSSYHVASKKVMVDFDSIESISASSGSYVVSTNTLKIPNIDISTSSGSQMKLTLEAQQITSRSSSGSNLTLKGNSKNFAGNSSSGSQLDASKLSSDYCETKASSGSDLSVNCDEEFIANASSGAHIENHEFSIKTTVKSSSGGHVDTKN